MTAPVTTGEAARVYRIPERTLRRWHTEGRLTARHRHGRWVFDAGEVEQLATLRGRGRLRRAPLMTDTHS